MKRIKFATVQYCGFRKVLYRFRGFVGFGVFSVTHKSSKTFWIYKDLMQKYEKVQMNIFDRLYMCPFQNGFYEFLRSWERRLRTSPICVI